MLSGVARLIANHRSSAPSKACQKSGPFPPPALPGLTGRTTLSDSRPARRARHDVGVATSDQNGSPPITRTTFPTCRAHYPGGSERVHTSVASPSHAAFPDRRAGRHPRFHCRGLLRLHSRYGPLDRSAAQGDLCHEASKRPVTQPHRSSATRSTDNSLGGSSLHWCSAPSGRTFRSWLKAEVTGSRIYVRSTPSNRHSGQGWECLRLPSRPGEFHPEPLTEPDVILSHHPAHAITRRLPPSAEQ